MSQLRQLVKAVHLWATSWRGFRFRTFVLEVLVALSLAFLVWIYTRTREQISLDMIQVPVQITLAPGTAGKFELEINGSSRVPVSFTGPPSQMRDLRRQIHRGLLKVSVQVAIPEERQDDSTYHDAVQIQADTVPVPPGIATVIAQGHDCIPYTLHRLVEKHLPVRLDYVGEARISEIKIEPATVMVRGPKEVLDHTWEIPTQPYALPSSSETTVANTVMRGQATLVQQIDGQRIRPVPANVSFRFQFHPRQSVYKLKDVPVRFLCPADLPWKPRFAAAADGRIALSVVGPAGAEPPVLAFVDLTGANLVAGRNTAPVRVELPRDFRLNADPPGQITFHLDPFLQPTVYPEGEEAVGGVR